MADSFNEFIQKWITPLTLLTFFGAIVWGVQLNIITIQHTEAIASQQRQLHILEEDDNTTAISLAQGIIVQQQMVRALERIEKKVTRHAEEAEEWKRRIILNEQRLKRGE